jgi:TonB family protein
MVLVSALLACGHAAAPPSPAPPRNVAPPDAAVAPGAAPSSDAELAVANKIASTYMRSVERCYKSDLKQDPSLEGKVVLQLQLDAAGRVVEAHATGLDDAFDQCVEVTARSWQFEPPGEHGETEFVVPFRLIAD